MKLGNYLTSLNGANAGLGGYIKSLGIAKLKTIALSIATTSLNMVIGAIASAIASFVIKGISNIINSAENMKKAVDDMVTSYDDSLKTLESHKKTINDIKDDYATLSKGVDELGNNVSLTTDEYKKYQDICNQIADIYPSLIAGHTSEGNAILTLKGNVEALTKAYKDEQKAAAASVISGSDKENTNVVKNYKNESKTGIKDAFKSAFTFNSDKSMVNGLSTTQKISYLERATTLSTNDLKNKSGSIGSDNVFRSLLKTYGLDTDSTDQEVTTIIQNMKADLATYQAEVDEAMKGIKTKANAYFVYNSDYDNLNDEQINQISSLIDKALTEEIADTFNKDSDINSKFVQKIIDGIENNKEGISNAYKSLLAIDPNDMGDVSKDKQAIDDYIKKIADYIGTDAESLKKGLGYDVADDISEQYNNIIEEAKKKESDFDWDSWFKEHSVNTQEEINKWKEIASSANSAAKARENYAKQANTFKETKLFDMGSDNAPSTLSKLNSQLDEIQSAYSTLSSAVSEYNSNGNISIDTMQSVIALGDNWLDYIDMESGAFTLDQEALDKLTQARIEDMKQQALANLASTVESITTEADATKYLASTNYDAANSYQELAKAKLSEVQSNLQKKVEEGSLSQDSYDKIISKFESDANKISQIFDNTSFKLTSDGSIGDSLSELESHADLLKSVQDELQNTNRLSSSTLDSIAKVFPELNESVKQFRNGLLSSEELFALLEQAYNDDADAYISNQIKKSQYDGTYYDNLVSANNEFFQGLFDAYGEDFKKSKNLAQAKQKINDEIISHLSTQWGKFYQTEIDNVTGLMKITSAATSMDDDMDLGLALYQTGETEEEFFSPLLAELQKDVDNYNELQKMSFDTSWDKINTSWQSLGKDLSSSNDSSSSQTAEKLNWIERLVNKISTAYSRLKNVVSDTTTTWLNRNNALSDSMSTLADKINAQSDAYEYYMNAFNSYGLDDYYKNQIANGSISIDVIYDDDLKNAISDCQDFYDKAQDAKTAVQELNIELKGLAKSRFDNVASEFENELKEFENKLTELQNENTLLETQGYVNSENSFNRMLDNEKSRMNKLSDEYNSLIAKRDEAVSAGNIKKYSEDWYTMQSEIDSVANSIADCKKNIADFSKELKQLSWNKFDLGQEYISDFINETEFLESLIEKNYDDSGNITPEGQANMALHIQGYQSYKKQAEAYSTEITKINKDLANDPNNTTLINRKRELIKSQQEAIKSYKDEQKSIKDLVSEGFESYKNSLDEIIQKYKDMLSTSKDLYDYQKNIKEQTDNINSLNKRILANSGDNSEEAKKINQQLKVELNKANDELNETEYEKLISDTEKLLDDLSDEVKTIFDKRIDNIDADFDKLIDSVDSNVPGIYGTIKELADSVGYNMSNSMNDMIDFSLKGNDTLSSIALTLNNIYAYVGDIYKQANNLTQKGWNLDANGNYTYTDNKGNIVKNDWIKDSEKWYHMGSSGTMDKDTWIHNDSGTWSYIDSKGKAIDTGWSQINGKWYNFNENGTMRSMDWIHNNDDTWSYVGAEGDAQVGWSQIAGKWYYFDENGVMASNKWIGDYFFKSNGEMASNTWIGHNGKYYWVDSNGQWKDITGWTLNNKPDDGLPLYQYKNGTKYAHGGISLTDEDGLGSEAIVTKYGVLRQLDSGDTVFNKEQVQQLWNMSKGITPNMGLSNIISKLPDIPVNSKSMSNKVDISYGDVTLTFPNVHNYEDIMKQMQKDPKAEKMIQEMTLGQTLGRNSLNKLTFR
jgi:glucan-binding YG repeat protein